MKGTNSKMMKSSKPWTRWWWFAGPVDIEAAEKQLQWTKDSGFGGVEIAWLYPYNGINLPDTPSFLSPQWRNAVLKVSSICRNLGLGCDFTYSTAWPFCGSFLPPEYQSQNLDGPSSQVVTKSWARSKSEKSVPVLNHMDSAAVSYYMEYYLDNGFRDFAKNNPGCSFFCDSLEVETAKLSFQGLPEILMKKCAVKKEELIKKLADSPDARYEYRRLISQRFLDVFFKIYIKYCHKAGALARVQCHGAMTNLIDAYSMVDIPETETVLFSPSFSAIAASAAALSGRRLVSSESFTCLYGWVPAPQRAPRIKQEDIGDLKALADAQFAFGVNHVVYHGMPFWEKEFYATVHVGPDGALAPYLPSFNRYLEQISSIMRRGISYAGVAVYFPFEDQLMKDEIPASNKTISNHYFWECQEVRFDDRLRKHRPIFVSGQHLRRAVFNGSEICFGGGIKVPALILDSDFIDYDSLLAIKSLQESGAPVIIMKRPAEPGLSKHADHCAITDSLIKSSYDISTLKPVLESQAPFDYWIRKEYNTYYIFCANPYCKNLHYPLEYRFSKKIGSCESAVVFSSLAGNQYSVVLHFSQNGSCLVKIDDSNHTLSIININNC